MGVSVVCKGRAYVCVWACGSRVWGVCVCVCVCVCVTIVFLVQFAAEMSHLLAASIEMAHLIGCTLCS